MAPRVQPAFVRTQPARRDMSQVSGSSGDDSTEYWFDQLIDHTNPSAGTFKQRYFFDYSFWKGAGSPIVLSTPGEQSADGFYTNLSGASLQHAMMQIFGAAGIVLEHRYWGSSSPFPDLTAANLKYLTVDQSIEDLKYFAENVQLPFSTAVNTNPASTPWVNIGCSYPGLLTAYTQEKYPNLFAAAYATSAPIQADGDYWEYWEPIEEGMPKNCSTDVAAAVAYMDNVMTTGSPSDVTALKTQFGMESLGNDDFGSALQWPLNTWQDLQPPDYGNSGESTFYQFCDAVEGGNANSPATGVGLPTALNNWAKWFKANGPDSDCPNSGGSCYSTYQYASPQYTDTSVSDKYERAWVWLLCTELGWFQVGDPGNSSSIVSSMVTPAYNNRQCSYMFPNADGTPGNFSGADVNDFNIETKGWNLMATNLQVVNGQYDPWRSSSLSSDWAPKFVDTPSQDINVIPGAHHCWDFYLANSVINSDVLAVQNEGIQTVHGWLNNWYTAHPNITNTLPVLTNATNGPAAPFGVLNATLTSLNETSVSSGFHNATNSAQNALEKAEGNKTLALASYITNLVLLILLIWALLELWKNKKAAGFKARGTVGGIPLIPRWGGPAQGDNLGEYGVGSAAGGRGQYQTLKEQH